MIVVVKKGLVRVVAVVVADSGVIAFDTQRLKTITNLVHRSILIMPIVFHLGNCWEKKNNLSKIELNT